MQEEQYYGVLEKRHIYFGENDNKVKSLNKNSSVHEENIVSSEILKSKTTDSCKSEVDILTDTFDDISELVPLYQGEISKHEIKCNKKIQPKPKENKTTFGNNKSNKMSLVLNSLRPSKTYLRIYHEKSGLKTTNTKNSYINTTRAENGDCTRRSDISNASSASFTSDNESFYLKVTNDKDYIVPPLKLNYEPSCLEISRGSSCSSINTQYSVNQQPPPKTKNVKVLKKIVSGCHKMTSSNSEVYLDKNPITTQVSSWKRRQLYGNTVSQKNTIKMNELKTLKELDVK